MNIKSDLETLKRYKLWYDGDSGSKPSTAEIEDAIDSVLAWHEDYDKNYSLLEKKIHEGVNETARLRAQGFIDGIGITITPEGKTAFVSSSENENNKV